MVGPSEPADPSQLPNGNSSKVIDKGTVEENHARRRARREDRRNNKYKNKQQNKLLKAAEEKIEIIVGFGGDAKNEGVDNPEPTACPPCPPKEEAPKGPFPAQKKGKQPIGFHMFYRAKRWDELRGYIQEHPECLMHPNNQHSTPMMFMASNPEVPDEIMEFMLSLPNAGELASVRLRHENSADRAARAGRPELANRLRALIMTAPRNSNPHTVWCPHCGDPTSKATRLKKMVTKVKNGEEENPLLKAFYSDEKVIDQLDQIEFHRVTAMKRCRKEISEAMACIQAARNLTNLNRDSDVHIIDLCCGCSMISAYLAFAAPKCTITMVDNNAHSQMPHYAEAGIPPERVQFQRMDLFDKKFVHDLEQKIIAIGKPTILLGMHLCGYLSSVAVKAFHEISLVDSIVLAPCCLPSREREGVDIAPPSVKQGRDEAQMYKNWAAYLTDSLSGGNAQTNSFTDENIISTKNAIITARKTKKPPSVDLVDRRVEKRETSRNLDRPDIWKDSCCYSFLTAVLSQ